MLHRLPNEILLKILEKTKSKTVKECRLLNSQFDNLIQRFQLHLRKIDELSITTYNNEVYDFFRHSTEPECPYYKNLTYNTYEEMFTGLNIQIKKVRSVKRISFTGISITEDLIRLFNNQRWLRKLDYLAVLECTLDRNAEPYWFSFLSKLRLNVLFIRDQGPFIEAAKGFAFPKTILNNVREFQYSSGGNTGNYTGDAIEIPWMDDSLLENYLDSGKTIQVIYAFTSYTLGGVKEFLMKVSKSNRNISWWSGIMKNVTAEKMDSLLKELKAEYRKFYNRHDKCIIFRVTKLGAKHDIRMQTCRNSQLD